MAEFGRIQPIKRPPPHLTAKLPPHIQMKLDDPSYDIRNDPEGMQHLRTAAGMGGAASTSQPQPSQATPKQQYRQPAPILGQQQAAGGGPSPSSYSISASLSGYAGGGPMGGSRTKLPSVPPGTGPGIKAAYAAATTGGPSASSLRGGAARLPQVPRGTSRKGLKSSYQKATAEDDWMKQASPQQKQAYAKRQYEQATAPPLSKWQRLSKNVSPGQFAKHPVGQALVRASLASQVGKSFRHAGFGAALRYSLGAEPINPRLRNYVHAQALQRVLRGGGNAPSSLDPTHFAPLEGPGGEP